VTANIKVVHEPNADWKPLPREAVYAGRALDELVIAWAHWNLSQSDCVNNPSVDPDGSLCRLDQDEKSPVFFVAPGMYPTVRSKCTVDTDQAILFPLDYFYADGLSNPLGFNTPPEGREGEARQILETMRDWKLVIDGLQIDELDQLVVGPLKLTQSLPVGENYYSCAGIEEVPGVADPVYLVGHFALLPPATPGTHRVDFGGTYSYSGWDYVNMVEFTFSAE
jgi:hypothetical protein